MCVVLEVRVFPLIGRGFDDRWLNIPAVGSGKTTCSKSAKIRSATVADGFVRLPPNDGGLGNVPRAG